MLTVSPILGASVMMNGPLVLLGLCVLLGIGLTVALY